MDRAVPHGGRKKGGSSSVACARAGGLVAGSDALLMVAADGWKAGVHDGGGGF
jgi:hypothetical protein